MLARIDRAAGRLCRVRFVTFAVEAYDATLTEGREGTMPPATARTAASPVGNHLGAVRG